MLGLGLEGRNVTRELHIDRQPEKGGIALQVGQVVENARLLIVEFFKDAGFLIFRGHKAFYAQSYLLIISY